ncbi:tetratricopeptide repeat protein [Govanella unica]|uniref:Uncharacterized protein n=1 Tax=Govanella unica TaxID=2975056 RepID=A0A9X3Z7U4_9PROT|nr:hypothetical protein [Govania unica]MDA5194610.1 hypothetical protein [Govania unica]
MSRLIRCPLWLVVIFLLLPGLAGAATLMDGENAFVAGRFEEAITIGRGLGTADGDSLLARAALVEAAYLAPANQREPYLAEAEAAARQALVRDPDHVEAMLHLVIALGYRARIMGKMAAHRAGLGQEAKILLDRARALKPDDPWVWAVRGGWNGEIAATGGMFGKLLYGATAEEADADFAQAMRLDPADPVLPVEYAKMLLRLNTKAYGPRAQDLLIAESLSPPRTAFEHILADQGADLLRALQSGDRETLRLALKRAVPFSQ